MALRFECPVCKHVLTAQPTAAGKKARCPACSFVMVVPSASTIGETPVDATDLLAMLGDRPIEAPPPQEPKARPPARRAAGKETGDESLYKPDAELRDDRARQREKNRGAWSVFVADCFRCIDAAMGLSSILFMVLLLVVLAGGAFVGGIFLIRASNGKAADDLLKFIATGPGQSVCILLGIVLGLYVAGYFMAYFIESTVYKLRTLSLAPCFPGLGPGKLMMAGFKALVVMLVYVAPVVTIPLLPLGLMALAHTDDWRAFDLMWAAKAAIKRPLALAIAWAAMLVYGGIGLGVLAALWPFLGSFLNPESVGGIQGPVLTLSLLAVGVTVSLVVATTVGSIIGSVSGVLGWHYPDLTGSLPPRNKSGGSIVSAAIVAAVGAIITAASSLAAPFEFTHNTRQAVTLAWFFSDALTQTAKAGHVSPEPEQWAGAWKEFFPIAPPPPPARPVAQAPTGEPSEPLASTPKTNESESPSPAPSAQPAANPSSPSAAAPTPPPAAPSAVAPAAPAFARGGIASSDMYERMLPAKAALQKFRQEHEGQNPAALAEFFPGGEPPGSAMKFLPGQAGQCPPDDIVLYDAAKCSDCKAVAVNQDLRVVTMPTEELRRRLQEQNTRPNGQTDRRTARTIFLHRDLAGGDEIARAQDNLNNLTADLQEYADIHSGQFPPSLAELKSLTAFRPADLADPSGKPYVYIPGQAANSPSQNVLVYDPTAYRDASGKPVALRLQVDGQVPVKAGEDLAAVRKLLDSQSPSVADSLKPVAARPAEGAAASQPVRVRPRLSPAEDEGQPPAATAGGDKPAEKPDLVDWDTPDLIAVDAVKHIFYKVCQATKEFKQGNYTCFAGVIIGPEAASKSDDTYAAFSKQMARKYEDVLAHGTNIHSRKDISQKLNGIEYDRSHAEEGQMFMTILRAVENGRCVCYWYHGTTDGFGRFVSAALGKAKWKN